MAPVVEVALEREDTAPAGLVAVPAALTALEREVALEVEDSDREV